MSTADAAANLGEAIRLLHDARTALEIAKLDLSGDDFHAVAEVCSEISEFRRQLGAVAARCVDGGTK